jgi:hypothetical protein
MKLTEKELLALQDTDFLLTKSGVISKLYKLLENTRKELKGIIKNSNFAFPKGTEIKIGKISRGENYLNLPYMVLDYPAMFLNDDVFAYRTMFWWGNFFSSTLHLEGKSLESYRDFLIDNIEKLIGQNIFIGVGKTAWQYHYEENNYIPITVNHKDNISKNNFLKLSKKIEIGEWNSVPKFASIFLEFILSILVSK